MCAKTQKTIQYTILAINCIISCLFTVLEQFLSDTKDAITMDVICLLCALFFSFINITGYLNWNRGDISPFFFWALILKRVFVIGIKEIEFVYFLFGFLNGIYTNKLLIVDENNYYQISKTIVTMIVAIFLIIFNTITKQVDYFIIIIIIISIQSILIGIHENYDINNHQKQQLENYKTDLKNNERIELKKCQTTIVQQQSNSKTLWDQFIQQTDDWVCKMEINKMQFNENLDNCEKNYSLNKSLQDYKLKLSELFLNLQVISCQTSLQQSIQLHTEVTETTSLMTWLQKNYLVDSSAGKLEILKYKSNRSNLDVLQGDDQVSIYSPFSDNKVIFSNQNHELSGISAIPHQLDLQGSASIQQGRITLICHMTHNQQSVDLSVQVLLIEEDSVSEGKKSSLVFILRNIDKQIKTKVQLERSELQISIFFKFISRAATETGNITQLLNEIKKIFNQKFTELEKIKQQNFISLSFCDDGAFVRSDKHITDSKASHHLSVPKQVTNTEQKITSSHSQNHEEENIQRALIGQIQSFSDTRKLLEQANCLAIMLDQVNFNFFELFSNSTKWKEEKINLKSTLNVIQEFYKNSNQFNQLQITLHLDIQNETEMELITDKRRVKQILFNFINNSIERFELNQYMRQGDKITQQSSSQQVLTLQKSDQKFNLTNFITIKVLGKKDQIQFEITDNAGGIQQESLKNRNNECKLGISANLKLLKQMAYDKQKLLEIINYVKIDGIKGTVISFTLPKILSLNEQQTHNDNSLNQDSITIINRVDQY